MHTAQFIAEVTGNRGNPGHQVTPDDELRALMAAQRIIDELTPRIGRNTTSPTHAAFFAHVAEHAQDSAAHAQLIAADLAQRTLVHELPVDVLNELQPLAKDPAGYISGQRRLPDDPRSVPTGRPTFKNTIEFLQNTLSIEFFEARARMDSVARLFPHTDAHGVTRPPRFAKLADELAAGNASPKDVSLAAQRLEKLRPHINSQPDPDALAAELEARVAESVRREDPRSTKKLLGTFQSSLEQQSTVPTEELVNSRIGLFYRGQRFGTAEFILRTRASDAELILSLCAQTDNPRTKAGNRSTLLNQSTFGTPAPVPGRAPTPRVPRPVPDSPAADLSVAPDRPAAAEESSTTGAPTVFPDFLLAASDDTGQPLHTPEELEALTLDDDMAASAAPYDSLTGAAEGVDGLTRPQRHLQGLLNLLRSNGRPANGKKAAGLPSPQLLIFARLEDLEARATGFGATAHGQKLSPAQLRQELCHADVIPMIMNGQSQVLDLGRSERYFPDYMRQAILARDGGCIVPGCTVPPEHCEIHHLTPWEAGGRTGIRDGTPACSNHHHAFHAGQIKAVLNADGLPAVILPRFMDRRQIPRRNDAWNPQPNLTAPLLF